MNNLTIQITGPILATLLIFNISSGLKAQDISLLSASHIRSAAPADTDTVIKNNKEYRFSVPAQIVKLAPHKGGNGLILKTSEGLLKVVQMPEHDFDFRVGQKLEVSYESSYATAKKESPRPVVLYDFDLK